VSASRLTTAQGKIATPGELLLHPVSIVAGALLVINDQILKSEWPGAVTGKLSDIAGLILFPLLLVSLAECFRFLLRRRILVESDELLWPLICGLGFILVKCTALGNSAYARSVGSIRWPVHAVVAEFHHDALPSIQPILVARDYTDLTVLGVLVLPYILTRARRTHLCARIVQVPAAR
jgi:hypothetical protein